MSKRVTNNFTARLNVKKSTTFNILLLFIVVLFPHTFGRPILEKDADTILANASLPQSAVIARKIIPQDDSQADGGQVTQWDDPTHVGSNPSATLARNINTNLPIHAQSTLKLPATPRPETNLPASAAGVLPISKDPLTGEVMVLFGLEYRWWDTHSKIVITDFGGKIDPGETKKLAAAREFAEETAGIYPAYRNRGFTNASSDLIELKTSQTTHPTFKGYASYLLPMPYKETSEIQKLADIMRRDPGNHVEKDDYYWVKLSDVLRFQDKLFVKYKGANRKVTVYNHSQRKNVTLDLNANTNIYLFNDFWKFILSDPDVLSYLQEFIDVNRSGASSHALNPATVPQMPIPPIIFSDIDENWKAATNTGLNGGKPTGPLKGAGVLPISKDPKTGKVVVLLGDETATQIASNLQGFLDFGGTADHPKMTPRALASREFMEETCFAYHEYFTGQPLDISTLTDGKIKQLLNNTQARSEAIPLLFASPRKNKYALYTLPIPYLSADELQKRRKAVQDKVTNTGDSDLRPLFEKGELAWVPLEDLIRESQTLAPINPGNTSTSPIKWRFFGGRSNQSRDDGFNAPQNATQKANALKYLQEIIDNNQTP